MKSYIYFSLSVVFIFLLVFTPKTYASSEKTLFILVDELSFSDIDTIVNKTPFGIGFINIKTLENDIEESLYLSIALGRKVGLSSHFQGLNKKSDGEILIVGFEDMLDSTINEGDDSFNNLLGERLKDEGISYIGKSPSAIIAADERGHIKSGEVEINYDLNWLIERTNYYLADSNILVLDYQIAKEKDRLIILRDYLDELNENRIILMPKRVSQDMENAFNSYLVPILYKSHDKVGILTSSSTRRDGFIVLEDLYGELISLYDIKDSSTIGNKIELIEKANNLKHIKKVYYDTENLIKISSIFHGIIYAIQFFCALALYGIRKRGIIEKIHLLYSLAAVSIFISFIMGILKYQVNIFVYVLMNLLTSYLLVLIMENRGINTLSLFSLLIYGFTVTAELFFPQVIYKSYIGVNNLFYGARYYGFNNGMMGIFIASSIVSCLYLKERINNRFIINFVYILFSLINMLILSARYGANTGGFITASLLFLIIIYQRFFKKIGSVKTIVILALFAMLIFALNIYFDVLSEEKSHAINFLMRVKEYGAKEFFSMAFIKAKELIKLTLLPPFSIAIVSQLYSLKYLYTRVNRRFANDVMLIFLVSLIAFMINDTGNIAFIFMNHFVIAVLLDRYVKDFLL